MKKVKRPQKPAEQPLFDVACWDEDSEASAETFVLQATSAEDVGETSRDELVAEDLGGPFLEIDPRLEPDWFSSEEAT